MTTTQIKLFPEQTLKIDSDDWTFNGASTRQLTHCYHDYPARMIPQVASKILDMFLPYEGGLLFDPYCGTGTSLVEGLIRGINVVGTDLNPLARLIAKAKTSIPDEKELLKQLSRFQKFSNSPKSSSPTRLPAVLGIKNLDFWFKPVVIEKLTHLKTFVENISDVKVKLFFQVAFSETVRESSNTRNEEFKLYRYEPSRLRDFKPNVFQIMSEKLYRNSAGFRAFRTAIQKAKRKPKAKIHEFNTVFSVPANKLQPESVDTVVTSPPYGDSRTTVAYGQYSRLSAAWLGLPDSDRIDRQLMGGDVYKELPAFPSEALMNALKLIKEVDEKRAFEVGAFYTDLFRSIEHVAETIRPGGHACYVVGNRKVKGVVLPTDAIIRKFFECFGFKHAHTFHRSIPNKRMPMRNSPTNAVGATETTMTREQIVVMQKVAS